MSYRNRRLGFDSGTERGSARLTKEFLSMQTRLSATFLFLCVVVGSSGCGSQSRFLPLAGAYQDPKAAAQTIGRCVQTEIPVSVEPCRPFRVMYTGASQFTGGKTTKESIAAAVSAAVQADLPLQCRADDISALVGKLSVRADDLTFESAIEPESEQWLFAGARECCDGGKVRDACQQLSVISSIYKTTLKTSKTIESLGLTTNTKISCSQAANVGIKVDVGSSKEIQLSSTGWNVVKVVPMSMVCAKWVDGNEAATNTVVVERKFDMKKPISTTLEGCAKCSLIRGEREWSEWEKGDKNWRACDEYPRPDVIGNRISSDFDNPYYKDNRGECIYLFECVPKSGEVCK